MLLEKPSEQSRRNLRRRRLQYGSLGERQGAGVAVGLHEEADLGAHSG